MDTHKNARLTPKGREEMVRAVVGRGMSKAAAARQFNTTLVGKWVGRFCAEGVDGLRDRSSRPLSSPSQIPLATADAVDTGAAAAAGHRATLAMTRRVLVWQRSVALDEATAARRAQPRAQRLGRFASIRRDADAMPDRRVAHGRAHEERLTAAKDRLIFLLELGVSGKRVALQTIAD